MHQSEANQAQTFEGNVKDVKALLNHGHKAKDKRARNKPRNTAPPANAEQRSAVYARMRKQEEANKEQLKAIMAQYGCSRRQAAKIRSKKRVFLQFKLDVAIQDEMVRANTSLGSKHKKRGSTGGGHNGPFRGPSKRPHGTSNKDWSDYMTGRSKTL